MQTSIRKRTPFKYKLQSLLLMWTCIFSFGTNSLCVHANVIDYEAEADARKNLPIQTNEIENWPQGPQISADAAILMEVETGTILYAKNIYETEYPASTTKLLTSLLAMEHCSMNEIVTFSYDAVFSVPWDGSNIGMDEGQALTMEQALYGVLVGSANEVSNAIAEHICGSMDDFATLMNERATQLGCVNSHFVNSNGLYDDNHYTCAYDLAIIAKEFFSYELLCKMASTPYYYIAPSDMQPDEIPIYSHNRLLPEKQYAYEYLVGSKTGYTDIARQTLVSCAEKDGMRLICVVLKEESPRQFEDTIALFDYGFSNFSKLNISQNETTYSIDNTDFFDTGTDIFGSSESIMTLDHSDSVILPVTVDFDDLTCDLSYDSEDADTIATLSYSYHGQPVGSTCIRITHNGQDSFTFDPEIQDIGSLNETQNTDTLSEQTQEQEEKVIFINVKKMIFIVIGIAVLTAVVLYLFTYIRSYQFTVKKRERKRRRRKTTYQPRRNTSSGTALDFRKSRRRRARRGDHRALRTKQLGRSHRKPQYRSNRRTYRTQESRPYRPQHKGSNNRTHK